MKNTIRFTTILACIFAAAGTRLFAQLNVPSDGSDGALNITTNTVIDLSRASYGDWNQNNATNAGNGVYDGSKWAVVFKYSSVNVASNCTVTFLNHPSHAPVVWLVQNSATVNGTINLDGTIYTNVYPNYLIPTEPAPGGFRGGAFSPSGSGAGYGPGGGPGGDPSYGANYGAGYGNPQVMPLLGGSGAGSVGGNSGSSGAGAFLMVCGATATVNGLITANGVGYSFYNLGQHAIYSGSGALRIVANQIQGSGTIQAGVVRTEANSISPQLVLTPNTVAVPPGTAPVIWPAVSSPVVTILSVNNVSAPADPLAGVSTSSDVSISTNNPVNIILQSSNFPPTGTIVVRVTPKYSNYFNVNATFQSGNFSSAIWQATTTLPNGFCVLQAHATSP